MEEHLGEQLTIDNICRETLISRSRLQKLFQELHGCGVMEFFNQMKIDTAKELIRSNHLNFTQIADRLGYASVHYFSGQFRSSPRPSACFRKTIADSETEPDYRYFSTMASMSAHFFSISATRASWVRQRSRLCPSLLMWK